MTHKILIIDDDPAVRGAFSLVLNDAGFQVTEAKEGVEGIAMVEADRPDLIFLDLRMPGIDGVETLRRLKRIDASLTVYIVTAFANEYMDQLKVALDEGLKFQLASKPLSTSQIRHIANSIRPLTDDEQQERKLMLTLYIVSINAEFQQFIDRLRQVLASTYKPGNWKLDIVEVLYMPEKALAHDIYATPMLVRDLPEPVLKILGDLSKMPSILAAVTSQLNEGSNTIVM